MCFFWPSGFRAVLGVLGQTGVETGEVVCGVLDRIRPSAVLAIDALAAGRLSRLLRTVQLADTGITLVAGVGNARAALNANRRSACQSSPSVCQPS